MMRRRSIIANSEGAAAAEMALVAPLLLIIMMGSLELGNYFYNEHILIKAVRDGARFAARQSFSYYDACTGTPTGPVEADTRTIVKTGLLSGGSDRLAAWDATTITVSSSCLSSPNSVPISGIYRGRTTGAPIVTVEAAVPYVPIVSAIGFRGGDVTLNARQRAAVTGI